MTAIQIQAPPQTSGRLGYIPALDGLRAVAVLAVMAFHFGSSWLPGGYIGVDVFFVLSGFLITTLLVQDSPVPPRLKQFWVRRVRRLFPALAVMLLAVAAYAVTTNALEQSAIRGQGLATVLYVNNWWLLFTDTSYFDALQQPSPLLHTWSLSVEEQWYLIFPILLIGLGILRGFRLRWIALGCAIAAVASTGWTLWLAVHGASANRLYLGTDTRAQQLLYGAVLGVAGVWALRRWGSRTGDLSTGVFDLLGLLGLGAIVLMFMHWPEGEAVAFQLPAASAATVCVVVAALAGARVSRLLGWDGLRLIGLISYALYLWHWPIAVMVPETIAWSAAVKVILTFAAAIASYYLVERPVRCASARTVLSLSAVLLVLVVGSLLVATPKASTVAISRGLPEHAAPPYSGDGTRMFVVGDSISGSLWLPLGDEPRPGFAVTGNFLLGCPLFGLRFTIDGQEVKGPDGFDCPAWEDQWRKDAAGMTPDVGIVVGTSTWQFDLLDDDGSVASFGSPEYKELLFAALDDHVPGLGAPRIYVATNPCTYLPPGAINDVKNDRGRTQTLSALLREYARERGYGVMDLTAATCSTGDEELFFDGLHLTKAGALRLWDRLLPQIDREGSAK